MTYEQYLDWHTARARAEAEGVVILIHNIYPEVGEHDYEVRAATPADFGEPMSRDAFKAAQTHIRFAYPWIEPPR